jgi:hypothetical protein
MNFHCELTVRHGQVKVSAELGDLLPLLDAERAAGQLGPAQGARRAHVPRRRHHTRPLRFGRAQHCTPQLLVGAGGGGGVGSPRLPGSGRGRAATGTPPTSAPRSAARPGGCQARVTCPRGSAVGASTGSQPVQSSSASVVRERSSELNRNTSRLGPDSTVCTGGAAGGPVKVSSVSPCGGKFQTQQVGRSQQAKPGVFGHRLGEDA